MLSTVKMFISRLLRRDTRELADAPMTDVFPGRWLGALSLIVAPLLLLAGEILKAPFYFYFPQQLAAHETHPTQMSWAYTLWTLGLFTMWPAFMILGALISRSRPWLGRIAGSIAIVGLFVNSYFEGINELAFELTDVHGVELATDFIDKFYASDYGGSVAFALRWTDNLGWILLAVGTLLTRTFGWFRFVCTLPMAGHASGVLKGFSIGGVIIDVLLWIAFASLAVELIRGRFKQEQSYREH